MATLRLVETGSKKDAAANRSDKAADKPKGVAARQTIGSVPGIEHEDRDPYAMTALGEVMDHASRAMIARMTGGLSPASLAEAWADWAIHLAASPGKQSQLWIKAWRKASAIPLAPMA